MIKQTHWKKPLAAVLTVGFLVLNTAVVLATPVELSLDDSIMMALQNNPAIKIADADRDSAEWSISEAKGAKKPTVSLNHSDTRAKSLSNTGNSFTNKISLSLPLYTGGKAEAGIEQAKINLKVNDLTVENSKQQVKLDATTGYFTILQTINALKVSQESVDMMAAHLNNVKAQYGVGVVAKSDVLRSEVELADYRQKQIIAQNNYDLAVASLNNVIGLPLDTEIKVKDELTHAKYALSLDDSVKYSMLHRPGAIQADYAIDAAKQGVKIAESGKRPTVSASAGTGWSDSTFPGMDDNSWSVGLSASWDVFDSGVTRSQIKQADSAVVKSVQQAKQSKDNIQLEVRQAYLNMNEADKRIATSQVTVEQAEEDFKIAGVRYSAGVGTNTDVIDAQVALMTAKMNYIQAMYDYNTSKADLDKAIGIAVVGK